MKYSIILVEIKYTHPGLWYPGRNKYVHAQTSGKKQLDNKMQKLYLGNLRGNQYDQER